MEGKLVNLKTYQAFTMTEALAAVKQDLGADAVILNTRTFRRGGFLGIWRRTIVEVTAVPAKDAQQKPSTPPLPKAQPNSVAASRAYARITMVDSKSPATGTGPIVSDQERTRTLALALEESHRRSTQNAKSNIPAEAVRQTSESAKPTTAAPAAKRFVLTSPAKAATRDAQENLMAQQISQYSAAAEPAVITPKMQEELSAIRELVGQVLHRQALAGGQPSSGLPKHLFDMYLRLISQDVADELANQIVNAVRDELNDESLEDETAVRNAVLRELATYIPVAKHAVPESSPDGRPLTIALIGPTGVGKTTTLAKLAASFKLRHGRKVGLITSDTYRIAAVDQLRTYANIIGLPLQVALTPAEMQSALIHLSDNDVILIDTAGRSQNDDNRLRELKQFINAANPHEVHLVLSSTAGQKVLLHEAEAFSAIGVHKIVLTKLDEAVSFGMLVNVIRKVGKQLSFVTTGQEVPTHLEVGRAERLAELILGAAVQNQAKTAELQHA